MTEPVLLDLPEGMTRQQLVGSGSSELMSRPARKTTWGKVSARGVAACARHGKTGVIFRYEQSCWCTPICHVLFALRTTGNAPSIATKVLLCASRQRWTTEGGADAILSDSV